MKFILSQSSFNDIFGAVNEFFLIMKDFKIFIRISKFAYVETLIYIVFQCHIW